MSDESLSELPGSTYPHLRSLNLPFIPIPFVPAPFALEVVENTSEGVLWLDGRSIGRALSIVMLPIPLSIAKFMLLLLLLLLETIGTTAHVPPTIVASTTGRRDEAGLHRCLVVL